MAGRMASEHCSRLVCTSPQHRGSGIFQFVALHDGFLPHLSSSHSAWVWVLLALQAPGRVPSWYCYHDLLHGGQSYDEKRTLRRAMSKQQPGSNPRTAGHHTVPGVYSAQKGSCGRQKKQKVRRSQLWIREILSRMLWEGRESAGEKQ